MYFIEYSVDDMPDDLIFLTCRSTNDEYLKKNSIRLSKEKGFSIEAVWKIEKEVKVDISILDCEIKIEK